MRDFLNYVLPGSVFFLFGIKWIFDIKKNRTVATDSKRSLVNCTNENQIQEEQSSCTATSPAHGRNGASVNSHKTKGTKLCDLLTRFPTEGWLKVLLALIGGILNIVSAFSNGKLESMTGILFASVYLFFGISGVVDILYFYVSEPFLPVGLNKFSLALAFALEGLMFQLQVNHQAFMQQHIHNLLIYVIFSCALICAIEIFLSESQLIRFLKAFGIILHGSWYIHAGIILHNPISTSKAAWTTSRDYNTALVGISLWFMWHCSGVFLGVLTISILSQLKDISNNTQKMSSSNQTQNMESTATHNGLSHEIIMVPFQTKM